MRSNSEHRAGDRPEYLFRDRAQEKLPESGASACTDYHEVRIVLLDRGSQAALDVAFFDQRLRADSGKSVENFLAMYIILGGRRFDVAWPIGRGGHGVHNRGAYIQGHKIGVIVFGNLLDVRDGLSGGLGKICSK